MDSTPHEQSTGGSDAPLGAGVLVILGQLAGFVAGALGEPWRVDVSAGLDARDPVAFLDGPEQARLRMSLDPQRSDRVKISGIYPAHRVQPVCHVEITVARDRGPAVIGLEITRRLLERYQRELARVRARTLELEHEDQTRRALLEDLLTRLGPNAHAAVETWDQGRLRVHSIGGMHGHLNADTTGRHGTIYLSSAPAALLLAIADLIAASTSTSSSPPQHPDTQ